MRVATVSDPQLATLSWKVSDRAASPLGLPEERRLPVTFTLVANAKIKLVLSESSQHCGCENRIRHQYELSVPVCLLSASRLLSFTLGISTDATEVFGLYTR
jgi:hypothetical protein